MMRRSLGVAQRRGMVLAFVVACLIHGASGCGLLIFGAGAAGGVAGTVYVMGKLEAEVDASVPRVQRASVGGLKSLGLPIAKNQGDQLTAALESRTADDQRIWIHVSSISKSRSKISIRVGYLGDEARSRRIFDAVRARL